MTERLRELREEAGRTQRQMADLLNITHSAYGQYERGKREMNYESLLMVADYFDVSLDYLFGRSDVKKAPPGVSQADYNFLEKVKTLDPRGRRTVQVLVEYERQLSKPS